jgi:hypothetical protein
MKISKRIKHVRRGRHTKRTGKHHTRRIKHRSKQYKRTYRKNNRKLKNNKRIQRGGTWNRDNTGDKLSYTTTCNLTYKKKGELMKDDNPFDILLQHLESNIFMVTMTRRTTPQKKFVIYFKLTKDAIYFSNIPTFVATTDNQFLSYNNRDKWWICLHELILNNQIVTTEIYTFPLNEMNKEVFKSFPFYMNSILESLSAKQLAEQQKARDDKIEEIKKSPKYLEFYRNITSKVTAKKQQLDESTTYTPREKQNLKDTLDKYMLDIISQQLYAMNMEETQPEMAQGIYSKVERLITDNIDSFVTIVEPASSSEHYGENDGPALSTPEQVRKVIALDGRGEEVYERPPATHPGYGSASGREDKLYL